MLDVDLPAEPQSASQARRAVLNAKGMAVDRDAIGVVVSEAVTNAAKWSLTGPSTFRGRTLAPEQVDPANWRHRAVGWGVVLPDVRRRGLGAALWFEGWQGPHS